MLADEKVESLSECDSSQHYYLTINQMHHCIIGTERIKVDFSLEQLVGDIYGVNVEAADDEGNISVANDLNTIR